MKKAIMTILVSTFLLLTSSVYAEKVKLTTMNWEPYIGKNLPGEGFVAEIATAAFKAGGIDEVEIFYLPWKKAVELAKMGNVEGLFPVWYNKNLLSDFDLSEDMPCGPVAFIKMQGTEFNYTGKVEELKPYKIGVVDGYINTEEIDNATDLQKVVAKDDLTNIQNLISGKVDVAILDPLVTKYLIENDKVLKPFMDRIETVKPLLREPKLYIAFSKNASGSAAAMEKYNAGMKTIRQNGTLQAILEKHKIQDIVK